MQQFSHVLRITTVDYCFKFNLHPHVSCNLILTKKLFLMSSQFHNHVIGY